MTKRKAAASKATAKKTTGTSASNTKSEIASDADQGEVADKDRIDFNDPTVTGSEAVMNALAAPESEEN